MPLNRFQTSFRLWAIASVVIFVALGFIDPVGGAAKGENSWWSKVVLLPSLNSHQLNEIVPPVLLYGAMLAVASAVLGWVIQAFIAVRRGPVRSRYEVLREQVRDVKS